MNEVDQKIKRELETVHITSDGRKFLKHNDALYAQSEIEKGIQIKLSKQRKVMDIVELIMNVLKGENWGVYYKNQPIQPLEMQDGNALYKVNQVDEVEVETAITKELTKDKPWKSSQTNSDQNENSTTG